MAFTLVTIFFLPLGFFAAFFGMNNQEINQASWMSLAEQIKYMCKSTLASSPTALTLFLRKLGFLLPLSQLRYLWLSAHGHEQTLQS
jgi:Mg2+ and Co2+ transporter CorA